ncbi:nineteen complex-related protein 2-domain-containing protein [Amylocarpus encephaloides]|uniref:Nineteen complex-related protein 2-domain-containing protein n=1 Tax=Amylocarpus encephaloides TaxID=45428 RepID=A0A9P7YEK2_9HELO|nr:nineteen complex-related protein 2-domain-containing protein [Amylocarpus encephaloides]
MMKSAFGSKRKARKIQVDEEEEEPGAKGLQPASVDSVPAASVTSSVKKPFKKSGLRQSFGFDELQQADDDTGGSSTDGPTGANKPTIGRSNSSMKRKKKTLSRLSFGPGETVSGDAAEALEEDESFTPKKPTLGRRVIEGSALRNSIPFPSRSGDDGEERPTYSKDYLNQLKNSTPNKPIEVADYQATAADEEGLDASELEGAMIVNTDPTPAHFPTEAEIREKKERRARLAGEQDFISFDEVGNDDRAQLSLLQRKKTAGSRLVRDDEDVAEGFDEFVNDGRISLGKKQEREARRRHRKEIELMINNAEGSSDGDSNDSEEERNAAYEAAQTRAGMDGLHKPDEEEEKTAAKQVPSKITPLPVLSECLARLQSTLSSMQMELAKKHKKVADLEIEKSEIVARETEVQELLKQSGERFAALKADSNGAVPDPKTLAEAIRRDGIMGMNADRGLESFGNTPTMRPTLEEMG